MNLILDTTLIDCILGQWNKSTNDFTEVYNHPVFRQLLAHAEDFQKREIGAEQYLYDLLHIDNIDMQQHQREIERNLAILKGVDLSKTAKEVEAFLPKDVCERMGNIYVHPVIGIGGLSIGDFFAIDPAPCPWYPADGSDAKKYLEEFIYPLLRHEPHHTGYRQIRPCADIKQLQNLGELAADMIRQIQMEGGAVLCEKQCLARILSKDELAEGAERFRKCDELIRNWLKHGECEISEDDWTAYYTLWGPEKLAYRLGEYICLLLIQYGAVASVGDCMAMEPLELWETGRGVIADL